MRILQPRSGYDAFISYRRRAAGAQAHLIRKGLKDHGLRAFMDVTDLDSGPFDKALLRRIEEASTFIVLLSPNALDTCANEGDWLRKEIACALQLTHLNAKRKIIPVVMDNFAFPEKLPEEIDNLRFQQGVEYSHNYVESTVEKIARLIGAVRPIWRRILLPTSLLLALVLAIFVVRYFIHGKPSATPTELALQSQALNLRSVKRFDEAVATNKDIIKLHGALEGFAVNEVNQIEGLLQKESSLIENGKSAESRNQLDQASKDYQDAAALRGLREFEATAALNAVVQKMSGISDTQIAQQSLNNGMAAFRSGQYGSAKAQIDQALSRAPDGWPQRPQAQDYSRKTANRIQQQQHLNQAQNYFSAKNYDAAKNEANQVVNMPDGDPGFVKQARDVLAGIPSPSSSAPAKPQPTSPVDATSPAMQALSRDAASLIQQGQFKFAWDKAASLEQAGGDANTLRQAIRSAEDNKLQQLSLRYAGVNTQSRPDLQTLLNSFQEFANNTANKQSEANQYVTRITGDIAAIDSAVAESPASQPPPVNPAVSPTTLSADDVAAIQHTLDAYAQAVANGDLAGVKAIRQLNSQEAQKMSAGIGAMRGKGYSLQRCSAPRLTGNGATVDCDVVLVRSKETPVAHVKFLLQKSRDAWIIAGTN